MLLTSKHRCKQTSYKHRCKQVRQQDAHPVWPPDGDHILKIWLFVSTEYTNVTDGQTDRQTDTARRHRSRLCIASRGKSHQQQYIAGCRRSR